MLCRDSQKSKQALEEIITQSNNQNIHLFPVDLSEPNPLRNAVQKMKSPAASGLRAEGLLATTLRPC
jgi:hypothetical protein